MGQGRQPSASVLLQQLPHGVLECLCVAATPRQRAHLSLVCKEWRDAVLHSSTALTVNLKSDIGAASASQWLQHHAGQLLELELSTVGLYGRHIHPPTRLLLFQSLHAAAGSAIAQNSERPEGDTSSDDEGDAATGTAKQHQPSTLQEEQQQTSRSATDTSALITAPDIAQQQLQPQAAVKPLRLKHLAANMRLAPADCAAIASLPAPQLVSLALMGSRTGRLALDGVSSLAQLQQLTSLKVDRLGIGDDAAVLLAQNLPGLLLLSLSGNNIGPAGAAALARYSTKLQHLDLSVNRIKDAGLSSICTSLLHLQFLSLSGNIKFAAATLQQLHPLQHLTQLQSSGNTLGNQGLAALAAALPSSLQVLDIANNKISKVDSLTGLVGLTSLNLSRNPLQLSCTKVLASGALPNLQDLVLFDAVSAKAVGALAGLAPILTSLTLGCDPTTTPDDATNLPLSKTRTVSGLMTAFADAGNLQVFSAPCTGFGDAQGKCLARFKGSALTALNLSYNCLSPEGLKVLRELPQLRRLELRAMHPELTDSAARIISTCSRLELLDLAYNDFSSDGVRQLGAGKLQHLQHLNLRNNVQVEKEAILAAAPGLSALTCLNLLELSDVTSRPGVRVAAVASSSAASSGGGDSVGAGTAHADVWAAFPNLQELVVGAYNQGGSAFTSGRLMISTGG